MSDPAERPTTETDTDAWATACQEDLAAEQARRRAEYGPAPVSAAEELRRLADTVSAKVAELGKPLGGPAGQFAVQGIAQQLIGQVRAAVEPVVERNPQVFDHLAAAGNELLAAARSAVQGQEQRWTGSLRPEDAAKQPEATGSGDEAPEDERRRTGRDGEDGPPGTEQIDLD